MKNDELVWSADYDIYGRLKNVKGERTFIPFRQVGQIEDSELEGLYYNRYRWYNSETGCYISQDPVGLAGNNPTLYGYVKNPNAWVDVFGLDCENITPRKANNLEGCPLENATQVRGRFPLENWPINGKLFRADNQNNVTSYAVYDEKGMIMKRVDVTPAIEEEIS